MTQVDLDWLAGLWGSRLRSVPAWLALVCAAVGVVLAVGKGMQDRRDAEELGKLYAVAAQLPQALPESAPLLPASNAALAPASRYDTPPDTQPLQMSRQALRNIQNRLPTLDPASAQFRPASLDWVLQRADRYARTGIEPDQALMLAVADLEVEPTAPDAGAAAPK